MISALSMASTFSPDLSFPSLVSVYVPALAVKIWDGATGELLCADARQPKGSESEEAEVVSMCLGAKGRKVITGDGRGHIKVILVLFGVWGRHGCRLTYSVIGTDSRASLNFFSFARSAFRSFNVVSRAAVYLLNFRDSGWKYEAGLNTPLLLCYDGFVQVP